MRDCDTTGSVSIGNVTDYTWAYENKPKPYRCPICDGRGELPHGFYGTITNDSTDMTSETCRSCQGQGVLWG